MAYFYSVVLAQYQELTLIHQEEKKKAKEGEDEKCLSALEEGDSGGVKALNSVQREAEGDNTFTELAMRTPAKVAADIAVETTPPAKFQATFLLPKPEEVIEVEANTVEMLVNASLDDDSSSAMELSAVSDVEAEVAEDINRTVLEQQQLLQQSQSVDKISNSLTPLAEEEDTLLLPPVIRPNPAQPSSSTTADVSQSNGDISTVRPAGIGSSTKSNSGSKRRSHSHSALVDIDSSFTPYKAKTGAAASRDQPKMKIFLPKADDDSDNSDDSDGSSSDDNCSKPELRASLSNC